VTAPAIVVDNLVKHYRLYDRPGDMVVEAVTRRPRHRLVEALRGVSFSVGKGEIVGILGRNGAGKSTLLKVMTGVLSPTSGAVRINGRVSQMLELGTGFDPELSGADNIYLGGLSIGMSRKEIERKYQSIVAFSELEADIARPFRTYSSGMQARLTFSVACSIDPEVLIVDEWLAVGDARFAAKCYDRIRQFRDAGASVVFVTHNYSTVTEFCDRGLILDKGQVYFEGSPSDTVFRYAELLFGAPSAPSAPSAAGEGAPAQTPADEPAGAAQERAIALNRIAHDFTHRFGDGAARFKAVAIRNHAGDLTSVLKSGEKFRVRIYIEVHAPIEEMVVGMFFKDAMGRVIAQTTSQCFQSVDKLANLPPGMQFSVTFSGLMTLSAGYYFLGVAMARPTAEKFDVVDNIVMFEVLDSPHVLRDSIVNFFPDYEVELPIAEAEVTESRVATG
jgi:ABC-type polysaccharide/polyol phosphate transport system ATPase subunit